PAGGHRAIRGPGRIERVVLVDQSPIGRTPRSCPVSYLGAYAPLREVFARLPAALARGLKDGAFSFNTAGGRCEHCEGAGWVTVEMVFLADLLVPCEVCEGRPLPPRHPRRALPGGQHPRGAGPDRGPGVRALRARAALHAPAHDAAPGRARLPPARPACAATLGRRGPAPQDRPRTLRAGGGCRPQEIGRAHV